MTENGSEKRRARDKDLHIRVTEEGLAAVDGMADEEHRTRSDMARILLMEAIAGRQKRALRGS